MTECDYDIVVIGGGPAGSFAARRLARAARRVLLVDRRPADGAAKACGHCLNGRVRPLLKREGLDHLVDGAAAGRTRRCRVHLQGGGFAEMAFPGKSSTCVTTPRAALDARLIDAAVEAGAEVARPARAALWRMNGNEAVVEVRSGRRIRRVATKLVLAADGLNSPTARAAGLGGDERRPGKIGFSFEVDAAGVTQPADAIDMFIVRGGYLGVVRGDAGRLHVGGLFDRRRAESAPPPMAFAAAVARSFPSLEPMIGGLGDAVNLCVTGPMPWRPRAVVRARVALVGDAAGYAEPFTGEGMSWAIESADLLADAVARAGAATWTEDSAQCYARSWRRSIGGAQRRCRAIARLLEHPRLGTTLLRLLRGETILHRLAAPIWSPQRGAVA